MKALLKKRPEAGLWLEEVPVPEVDINDVLIKILKTSICGTDIHIYLWDEWAQRTIKTPMVIGHEFVGRVEAVGSNVHDFYPGEIVSGEGHVVCGHCRNCLAGRRHLCMRPSGIGVNRAGCFAEYLSIPALNLWYADPQIPLEVISCFDPLGNATHTALSFDLVGEDVLITGAGPIGIMAAAVARRAGARYVVVSDFNRYRLELARKMGADLTVNLNEDTLEGAMEKLGMKEGFDVGLEMSGAGKALDDMIRLMCHGGKIAILGLQKPGTPIDWETVVFGGLTLKGIYGREIFETWYKMTAMIQSGLDIGPVITHRFEEADFQQAFEVMRSGQSGKVILNWS